MPRVFVLILFLLAALPVRHAIADDWFPDAEWGGHVKVAGQLSFPRQGTPFELVGLSPNLDETLDVRLNNKFFFGDFAYTEINYELIATGGGTRQDGQDLKKIMPQLFPNGLTSPVRDDRRLINLTAVMRQDHDMVLYHRLDRFMVALTPEWGEVRIGRQAVTWGHGFTYNPMDLFNPFTPTDVVRDYKIGDDMIHIQFEPFGLETEMVYVVRRNPVTEDVEFTQASLGGKVRFQVGETEIDLMGLRHFEDSVAGVGAAGYLGNTAWRLDATYTFLDTPVRDQKGYFSAVANLDYSWAWLDKNWYGFLEFYHNGLSTDQYAKDALDPAVHDRLARGELSAIGANYVSGHLKVELHPLVNLSVTEIVNLHDPSGVTLPNLIWSATQDHEVALSGASYWGPGNTEFGGLDVAGQDFRLKPSDSLTLRLTWFY